MWGKGNPCTLLMGMYIGRVTMGKCKRFLKELKIAIHDSAISFLDTYWKKTKTIIVKHIHNPIPNVHSSITFNIQNTEVTFVSSN